VTGFIYFLQRTRLERENPEYIFYIVGAVIAVAVLYEVYRMVSGKKDATDEPVENKK
jgi:hypothetical protein